MTEHFDNNTKIFTLYSTSTGIVVFREVVEEEFLRASIRNAIRLSEVEGFNEAKSKICKLLQENET